MKRREFLCLVAAGPFVAAGCVRESESPSPAAAPGANGAPAEVSAPQRGTFPVRGAEERLKIAVVPKGTTHEFWQTIKAGAEAAGQEVNAEILWNGPKAETDIQDQIDILQGFASQGAHGIVLAATDKNSLVATVEDLDRRGVPVIVIDSGVDSELPYSFVATDNVAAARMAAQEMGRLLNGQGKVAVLSFLKGAGTSDEREQGFLERIRAFPGIQVVGIEYTDSDSVKAADKMETFLAAHPDLAGVFASNEPNVVGAAGVLERRGLVGKVKLVGFDASDAEIQYLEKRVVQALVVQNPFKMGYEGVKAMAALLRGQGNPPERIDTGAVVATPENMRQPDVWKILDPLGKRKK